MPLISDKYFYSLRHSGSQILTNVGTPVGSRRRIYLKLARHAIAQKAVNMMYGEIDGHAHYLQTAYSIPKKVQLLWYDIVCKYWPRLKKHDKQSVKNTKAAFSVKHAKVHYFTVLSGTVCL